MAAKKKAARKKTARKVQPAKLVQAIEKELKVISKQIEKRLAPLRKEIDKAERKAGTRGAKLLREARHKLNTVDLKGRSDLDQFLRRRRRELSKALTELEGTVKPARKTAKRKKATRKKTVRKTA